MTRRQRRSHIILLAAALSGTTGTVFAQTQMQMDQETGAKLRAADARLNRVYHRLTTQVSSAQQARLIQAERAWIAFRDAECAFRAGNAAGGSIHPMLLALCRTELTRARADQLDAQTTCKTTDLLCGRQ